MGPDIGTTPTTKELELELTINRFQDAFAEVAKEKRSLVDQLKIQSDKVIRLEAQNVGLKMTRTDKELSSQVDGLRIEVGKKDRELVDLKRRLQTLQENEALILRRAASAEEKIRIQQTTMETFQKSRDAAHEAVERHDRERLEAVRTMIEAQDRAKKAEARVAELEKKQTVHPKKK